MIRVLFDPARLSMERSFHCKLSRIPILAFQLLALSLLLSGSLLFAQTAPFDVSAYPDPLAGVYVRYTHCQVAPTDQNCDANFGLYRSPDPGFNQAPIKICWANPNNSVDLCSDTTVKTGHTYTYQLCSGGAPLSDGSNCKASNPVTVPLPAQSPPKPTATLTSGATSILKGQETDLKWTSTNATSLDLEPQVGKVAAAGTTAVAPLQTTTYTLTASGPGGNATASVTITIPCLTPWLAPANLSAVSGLSDVPLKWTNPVTSPNQTCPAPSTQVLIYRSGTNGLQQIAALAKAGNPGTLPEQYTDSSLLLPHTSYEYAVCEGGPADWQNPTNCAFLPGAQHSIVTWGADPVLSATRDGANSVKLKLALDQASVSSIIVTRQGSDDPCRQGGTLGNGLQGCKTVGPNGGSPAQTVTVYNWTASSASQLPPGFQNSQSAPFVIDLPDDTTVKPGVEYYYLAQVTWLSTVGQQSNTITVPNAYTSAPSQQGLAGGIKVKPLANAPPPPPAPSSASPAAMVSPKSSRVAPAPPMMRTVEAPATTAPPATSAPMITTATPMLQSSAGASAPLLSQPSAIAGLSQQTTAGNLTASIKQVQQRPHDAQSLYALGKAYCASNGKRTGVSYMYMALLLAEQTGNAPLIAQIKTSLTELGVNAK